MNERVRIYVVTFRRPLLLKRALKSLQAQTHSNWVAEVLNDDPTDPAPGRLIEEINDPRITLFTDSARKGGAYRFNQAFSRIDEPFASLLEDDNWWEPEFLAAMISAINKYPGASVACGNERIWQELPNGEWQDTHSTIWPVAHDSVLHHPTIEGFCGRPVLCNSSLLFRTGNSEAWRTPNSIPIDVTEHFRERVIPFPIVLMPQPLVNYAETLRSYRASGTGLWSEYQVLLIGSVFELIPASLQKTLATRLIAIARSKGPWELTPLLAVGLFIPGGRELWRQASRLEKLRFGLTFLRHPIVTMNLARARSRHSDSWSFLSQGRFAEFARQTAVL